VDTGAHREPDTSEVDFTTAELPGPKAIVGARVRLEPIDVERHVDDLWEAAGDPDLWAYMPYGPFADRNALRAHLVAQEVSTDPRFYAVVADGRARGVVSFLRMDPSNGAIEIGHIWFGRDLQRTAAATEAIYLLARTAFDDLGNRRLEWKCNAANAASMRAAERFGFTYEGIFRQHLIVKGRNRDTAWFAIVDGDWPAIRAGFERWLAPGNFDAQGNQLRSLAESRSAAA
jgi:RimJ/RimL family protein N-acetyltransferase